MSVQDALTYSLVLPALVLGFVAWRASRAGRTEMGLSPRGGALAEFARGAVFSVPVAAALVAVFAVTGLSKISVGDVDPAEIAVVWAYFLFLMLIEEVAFRGLLMTGLGVVVGRGIALAVTAVLVAAPYAFADHTGVLPVLGAVVTNVLHGVAKWRSGRIWWGLGQRWVWNSLLITVGFADSAFRIDHPALHQHLAGPAVLTGGNFGVEGGLVGIAFLAVMIAAVLRLAHGRRGPWRVVQDRRDAPTRG